MFDVEHQIQTTLHKGFCLFIYKASLIWELSGILLNTKLLSIWDIGTKCLAELIVNVPPSVALMHFVFSINAVHQVPCTPLVKLTDVYTCFTNILYSI